MPNNILLFILIGFIAQIIDGTLGMAYGVTTNSLLLTLGVPVSSSSASIHTAETFTTCVSGISHYKAKNIRKVLFKKLLIPGVIGGILGAYVLTELPTHIISPIINVYLICMGIVILSKAFVKKKNNINLKKVKQLGFIGGVSDAIGGGGWGPIITSTLVASGGSPRYVIGSVNAAEFFITAVQTFTFMFLINIQDYWKIILGLAIGGVIAAPMGAVLCKKIPKKKMMVLLGILIIVLNIRNLIKFF